MNSSVKYHGHRIFVYFKGSPNIYIDDYTIASKSIRLDTVFTYTDLYLYGMPIPIQTYTYTVYLYLYGPFCFILIKISKSAKADVPYDRSNE